MNEKLVFIVVFGVNSPHEKLNMQVGMGKGGQEEQTAIWYHHLIVRDEVYGYA